LEDLCVKLLCVESYAKVEKVEKVDPESFAYVTAENVNADEREIVNYTDLEEAV
jgi:hypothetical protein